MFVTEDGAETDLDIGHDERFIDENVSRAANDRPEPSGSRAAQGAERRVPGRRAGIPHITDEIKARTARSPRR